MNKLTRARKNDKIKIKLTKCQPTAVSLLMWLRWKKMLIKEPKWNFRPSRSTEPAFFRKCQPKIPRNASSPRFQCIRPNSKFPAQWSRFSFRSECTATQSQYLHFQRRHPSNQIHKWTTGNIEIYLDLHNEFAITFVSLLNLRWLWLEEEYLPVAFIASSIECLSVFETPSPSIPL